MFCRIGPGMYGLAAPPSFAEVSLVGFGFGDLD